MKTPLTRNFTAKLVLLIVGLSLVLIYLPFEVKATEFFEDNFDSYSVGDFYNNGVWSTGNEGDYFIVNDVFLSYPNSLLIDIPATSTLSKTQAENLAQGRWGFSFLASDEGTGTGILKIYGNDDTDDLPFSISLSYLNNPRRLQLGSSDGGLSGYFLVPTGWHSLLIDWDCTGTATPSVRYKVDDNLWGNWYEYDLDCNGLKILVIGEQVNQNTGIFYLDNFVQTEGYGFCGSGLDCYYCFNQTACENAGCTWLEFPFPSLSICVETPPPIEEEGIFDFGNYYSENSDFSTPTAFITRLATATQPILAVLSSWISSFSNRFPLDQAKEYGEKMGKAIPIARGHMNFFNSLFSNLPISELLVIYLVVLLAIIIFRIVRQIKKLVAI